MQREANGWWSAASPRAGTDYAFALDGDAPLPDPRSRWQPNGVHGFSRIIDDCDFAWEDAAWNAPPLSSAIIYELHVGTFSQEGTFDAIIARLGYLKDLGVTHIELMPTAEFSGDRGWGYDGVDLFAPHHIYGGPGALKRLVNACHQHGLAVLIDVVFNHFGPSGNYLPRFGPYHTNRYRTPWGKAVNFDDQGSAEVRRFLCDSALMWLREYHCDGLRIDAVHEIFDRSAIHFLEQLSSEVRSLEAHLGRRLCLIAESDLNDPRVVRATEVGGYGIDAQWNDDFHHALHAYITGERSGYYLDFGSLGDVATALRSAYVYDGRYSRYRRRNHGRTPAELSGHRFVGFLQNHDQVGNRAKGERISMLVNLRMVKIASALVFVAPFVPMLFQGEEWAASSPFLYFSGHPEPELGRAVSEGRKREFVAFGWPEDEVPDPQALETYLRSKLNWDELTESPHGEMLDWYRRLIRLRKELPELSDGRRGRGEVAFSEVDRWLVYERGSILTVCNFSQATREIPCHYSAPPVMVLASDTNVEFSHQFLRLPAETVAIFKRS